MDQKRQQVGKMRNKQNKRQNPTKRKAKDKQKILKRNNRR